MTRAQTKAHAAAGIETDSRWGRIVARDRSADGVFWYSVVTTKVYCRPSCPSRAANPGNIMLHDTLAEARATGFRPCKRCHPDGLSHEAGNTILVEKACRLIEGSEVLPSLAALAESAGLSRGYFHRVFKASTGLTPKAYAAAHRAGRVRQALSQGQSVTEAIYAAGFNSSSRFYEKATAMLGATPMQYRAGVAGERIVFAVGQSSLGAILVASSDKGVVSILLGDAPDALLRQLQDRFSKAELVGGDAAYEAVVARAVGLVEAPALGLDLPLDVRGTAFQQRVWMALRDLPPGRTVSYTELAHKVGAPGAVRAVASACAQNAIAVAIPCHRVVRTDGGLSGYRWGVERKRSLIAREAEPDRIS